jgi:hypothetical protein
MATLTHLFISHLCCADKVAESTVEAIKSAQSSAAKEMQTVMAAMQKELMATLQAQDAELQKQKKK